MFNKFRQSTTFNVYKRIFVEYMAENWKVFIITLVAMTVAAATEPAFASLMKPLIDKGFTEQNHSTILWMPFAIVAIFFIRGLASYANETTSTWLSGSIVEKMRVQIFNRLLRMPVQYYDNNNSGRMISRITFDVTQITDSGFNVITVLVRDGLTIIGLLGLLFTINWELTLFCFFTLPVVFSVIRVLSKRLRRLSRNNQEQFGEMMQIITESVNGQKIVKLFNGYEYEEKRLGDYVKAIKTTNVKQASTSSLNSGVSQFMMSLALSVILFFATIQAKDNGFTAGGLVSFISAMILILQPMKRITSVTQAIQRGTAAAESVFEFLDETIEESKGTVNIDKPQGEIIFKNVEFKYPTSERNVLDDVNLTINKGQTVALVGSSGSGKTTLANMVPAFYQPQHGEIILDGVNLSDITLNSLRDNISLVSQDVVLFNDTIYNNITYGSNKRFSKEEVHEAAKLANALEFIEQMPEGFDTFIGDNGTRLSGGQKQRLAIARAILKNAPILILDEATSALDNQSEKLVQEAIDRLIQNRTTIVIAHRLSTIQNADKIVVLERGKVVETGKHDELLVQNGVYANLYNIQFKA